MTRKTTGRCLWCDGKVVVGHPGAPKVFCSHPHRQAFWNALRKVGYERYAAGEVTIKQLREQYTAAEKRAS